MNCPHCTATTIRKRAKKTELGYATFFCAMCRSYVKRVKMRTFSQRKLLLPQFSMLFNEFKSFCNTHARSAFDWH